MKLLVAWRVSRKTLWFAYLQALPKDFQNVLLTRYMHEAAL